MIPFEMLSFQKQNKTKKTDLFRTNPVTEIELRKIRKPHFIIFQKDSKFKKKSQFSTKEQNKKH
jgi:hypothetical protein